MASYIRRILQDRRIRRNLRLIDAYTNAVR